MACAFAPTPAPANELLYYDPFQFMNPKVGAEIPHRSPKAMSPIHALPVELLSRVFLLGQPDTPYPEFPPDSSPPFEVLVSHVCHHWRDIALSTQSLWTTLHFRLKSHMDRASFYLLRNDRHVIDILVDTCAEDEYEAGYNLFRDEFPRIFEPLKPIVGRWRSLALKVRDKGCKLGARDLLSSCGVAPQLEYLQLWHIENWENAERLFTQIGPPPVVIFNKELPSLRHLSLIGVNVPWTQVNFLKNLSTIEFALHSTDVRIPYDVWARMLAASPQLEKLSLHYSGPKPGDFAWPNDVIPLPGMRELALTDLDPPYLVDILRHLHMPHLARLRLELPAQEPEQSFAELIDELARPKRPAPLPDAPDAAKQRDAPMFPALETLAVEALDCAPKDFRRLLEAFPGAVRLELGCARLDEGLFEELLRVVEPVVAVKEEEGVKPRAVGCLLPVLHTVRVSGLESQKLVQFVKFRRAQGRPVKLWLLNDQMRNPELEKLEKEMQNLGGDESIEWFKSEEDDEDDEDEDDDDEEDAEVYTDDEVAEEAVVQPIPNVTSVGLPGDDDDEHVDYSDEEEDEDEED